MKNKLIGTLFFLAALILFCFPGKGQSIKRQTIGSYGGSSISNGILISQTVGQPFSTVSYSDQAGSVIPGFQQPVAFTQKKVESTGIFVDLKVYPNPATYQINIKPPKNISNALVKVRDINGKIILKEKIQDFRKYEINCQDWQKGIYTISISDNNQQNHFSTKILISK